MTQNLDLDLTINGSTMQVKRLDNSKVDFSNTYTDLNSKTNWVIPSGSQGYATQTTDMTKFWNEIGCSAGNVSSTDWTINSYRDTSNCDLGYEARSFDIGIKCYNSLTGIETTCTSNLNGSADRNHIGNHYNWPAATAGSGSANIISVETPATDSICPSGWHLPYGGAGTGQKAGNMPGGAYYLIHNRYNIQHGASSASEVDKVLVSPLYYVSSGYYNVNYAGYNEIGEAAWYWMDRLATYNKPYRLILHTKNNPYYVPDLYGGDNYDRAGFGGTIRCTTY